MVKRKQKYEVGTAANYITRTAALKKLHLNLRDFHKLCILKGIYPREPLNVKKANKGATLNRVFYHIADIKFLANEPLINKFRQQKAIMKKITTAKNKREHDVVERKYENMPGMEEEIRRIIVERYPTFNHALRDLDDALNLIGAFCLLPSGANVKPHVTEQCKKVMTEFLLYVIHTQRLTKAFISIKGIYFQAQVYGEKITWIQGHQCSPGSFTDVDLKMMSTFIRFYTELLAHINLRLYKKAGFHYPPILKNKNIATDGPVDDIYSITEEFAGRADEGENFDIFDEEDGANQAKEFETIRNLFKGKRFFLNRECPKDVLALIIRSCGGIVSWDGCQNAKFDENYSGIHYHIVDRPIVDFKMNRTYVQPQWIFDSFNFRTVLPTNKYAPGARLPPHASPFVQDGADAVRPENIQNLLERYEKAENKEKEIEKSKEEKKSAKTQKIRHKKPKEVVVKEGPVFNEKKQHLIETAERLQNQRKMREMMIPKKHKLVYKKMQFGIKRKAKEERALERKRQNLGVTDES